MSAELARQRRAALDHAMDLRPVGEDPLAFIQWVRDTDELTVNERELILSATWADLQAFATASQAEADQQLARIDALDRAVDLINKWCRPGDTVGQGMDRARSECPEEHDELVSLFDAIAPDGTITVEHQDDPTR